MNAEYKLPGEFIEALKTRPITEINGIFIALSTKKLAEITGCTSTEQLLQVQAQARMILELHQFILAEMKR